MPRVQRVFVADLDPDGCTTRPGASQRSGADAGRQRALTGILLGPGLPYPAVHAGAAEGRRSRRRSRTGALFGGTDRGPFKPV
jgi:hypothetical protein